MIKHPFIIVLSLIFFTSGVAIGFYTGSVWNALPGVGLGVLMLFIIRVANQWERAVILRFGKFTQLKGPGFFTIIPFVDTIPYTVDLRTITTPFTAEQTLTKDSVPVDVDAVLFWRVVDAEKAALEVANYQKAVAWSAQTALRDVIGETDLAEMLVGRREIDEKLRKIIDGRAEEWGIKVLSVELRDVKIPDNLQEAMSMQAQAERERQARVILGDSEAQIAQKFKKAAESYQGNPTALHLRAMNILLEGMKNNSTVIVVPSSSVETMGLGATTGMTALAKKLSDQNPKGE